MRREGSVFKGLGVVMLKELSDHLTSVRMRVLEWLVGLVALAALYGAIEQIKETYGRGPLPVPAAVQRRATAVPSSSRYSCSWYRWGRLGLGFDAVNRSATDPRCHAYLLSRSIGTRCCLGNFWRG